MIKYKSTRGNQKLYSFSKAILKGIADDGGLFVPQYLPKFTQNYLQLLQGKPYQEIAGFILNLFETDFTEALLKEVINKAYSSNFDKPTIAPVVYLKNNQYILELWHGPTAAFKDLALQLTPIFFSEAIKMSGENFKYLILTATSGDTGKAALEGFKDKENLSIIVFYPDNHVSRLQKLQMVTQDGSNVSVIAVKGDFDVVQKLVKGVFNDRKFNEKLQEKYQTILSSANSINWGRLIPQIIYHISSYLDLVNKNVIKIGKQIDIAVPTGNFGNILAAFYAKRMGLPVRKLICASNANNVLTEFLRTGIYSISKRKLIQTPSPSMDILIASNIERLLYTITENTDQVAGWMNELKEKGQFEVDEETKTVLKDEFFADWVSNQDCLQNIRKIYTETKYLMDPHTSVGQLVAERYIKQNSVHSPVIICGTAHWSKFAEEVYLALVGSRLPGDALKAITKLAPETFVPNSISSLGTKKIRFNKKCKANIKSLENLIKLQISP